MTVTVCILAWIARSAAAAAAHVSGREDGVVVGAATPVRVVEWATQSFRIDQGNICVLTKAAIIAVSRTLVARAACTVAPLRKFQQVAAEPGVRKLLVAGMAVARRRAVSSSTRRRVIVRFSTQASGTIASEEPTFKHGASVRVRTLGDNFIARLTP